MVYWEAFPVWAFILWENPQLSPASVSQQHFHGGESRTDKGRIIQVKLFFDPLRWSVCFLQQDISDPRPIAAGFCRPKKTDVQYLPPVSLFLSFCLTLTLQTNRVPLSTEDTKAQTSIGHSEAVDFSYKCLHRCRLVKFACWQKLVNGCNV